MTSISRAKINAVFFDLDGTLVDSALDLTIALKNTFDILGLKPHPEVKIKQWVGNGVDKLIHRALTDSMDGIAEKDKFDVARRIFDESYSLQAGRSCNIYPGVLKCLENLKQQHIKLVCITNKDRKFTEILLKESDLDKYFDVLVCGDDLAAKKPDPSMLLFAAEKTNEKIANCLMVGDSKSDVLAANRANIPIVCVSSGYSQGVDLKSMQIQGYISDLSKLDFSSIRFSKHEVA